MDPVWWQRLHGGSTHVPIVLLPLSLAFDLLATRAEEPSVRRAFNAAGFGLALAGTLGGMAAVAAGLALTRGTLLGTGGERLHHLFVWPGFAASVALVAWRWLRYRPTRARAADSRSRASGECGGRWRRAYLVGMSCAATSMLGAGYSGGEMLLGTPAPAAGPCVVGSSGTAEVAAGRELFLMNCAHCHGDDARGTDEAPDLTRFRKSDARIVSVVKNGIKGEMPRFGEKLNDAQVRSLARFIQSKQGN